MNKPKVTKIAFADGKAVRFRQEVEQMVVEYKMPGKPWVAIEPIALEPFVPANMSEMTNEALDDVAQRTGMSRDMVGAYYGLSRVHGGVSDDLSGIGRGEGATNRSILETGPSAVSAPWLRRERIEQYRDVYRNLPRDTEFHEISRQIRREIEQEIISGSRVRPRITPSVPEGDFVLRPTNEGVTFRLTNFSTDITDYPSIEEGVVLRGTLPELDAEVARRRSIEEARERVASLEEGGADGTGVH